MSHRNQERKEFQGVQLYPLGDAAIVLQFGDTISRQTHLTIQAFTAALEQQPFPGFREYVSRFSLSA
jgi:inhibitor of KinA